MLTPEQACRLSGQRKVVAQQRPFASAEKEALALRYAQVGLPFTSEHAAYLTVRLAPGSFSLSALRDLARDLNKRARDDEYKWVVVIGGQLQRWAEWCGGNGTPLDERLFEGHEQLREVLSHSPPYKLTPGDLFFHVKSCESGITEAVATSIREELGGAIEEYDITLGDSMHNGRIYGGRMLHGLIGSVDPVGFSARAVIGDDFPQHKGACFGVTQRFAHDWEQLLGMADNDLENLIGRDHNGNILLNDDQRCHIKVVRVNDEDGLNYRLVGESQPYRNPTKRMGKEDGIYQVAYAKTITAFVKVMQSMIGGLGGHIKSRHLNVSHADLGGYWYVPSACELGCDAPHDSLTVPMNKLFDKRSEKGRLFYNTHDFLHRMGNRVERPEPGLTDRVIELLNDSFSRWHDTWYRARSAPELGHLKGYLREDEQYFLAASIMIRKGVATQRTLELLSGDELGRQFDTYRIHPSEIIVGVVPDYTLGSGFETMQYLNAGERDEAHVLKLNESGAAGHNVPNYQRLLAKGVGGFLDEVKSRLSTAADDQAKDFYQAAVYSLEGVQAYMRHYAALASRLQNSLPQGARDACANLGTIAQRMAALATRPPVNFIEAAQLVFSMHCCMHIAGESVSIGRLDQLLAPFLDPSFDRDEAQEVIDCFWIKMNEKVLLNYRHFHDRLSRGSGAITYQGGDFPQGAALNQWVQQVTVGGYKANAAQPPEDACNEVTRMCLRAARRLPLTAPCLSLRVHPGMPDGILSEARDAILAGGAHPFLINDDKIVEGLIQSGMESAQTTPIVELADARDMVCDGCFESMVAGKSEFAFCFVPVPDAIEMAMNRGRTYAMAGPVHMTGLKMSFRSKRAEDIKDWDELYAIFREHYRFKLVEFYDGMLSRYGNLARVCPSPLLSTMIEGCLESGRDLTAGGARYKILAPLMCGISTAIDSLWAIKQMVFSDNAVFTLPELLHCLICDWGYDMKDPFYSPTLGEDRIAVEAERFREIRRRYALQLHKFGQGHEHVDRFARRLVSDLVQMAYDVFREPRGVVAAKLQALRERFSTPERPFEFVISPGIATFEDFAGVGSFLGASADGRRLRQPVASDFSPSPWPSDLPVPDKGRNARRSLLSWAAGTTDVSAKIIDPIGVGLSNGSPVDINIREGFPPDQLEQLICDFTAGKLGSNMMSISCADPTTLGEAQESPECYDLVRMRMGGWSEFFAAMLPHLQEQLKRRPIFEQDGPGDGSVGAKDSEGNET